MHHKLSQDEIRGLFRLFNLDAMFGIGSEWFKVSIQVPNNKKVNYVWYYTTGTLCKFFKKGGFFENTKQKFLDAEDLCIYLKNKHQTFNNN